jgi:hypothetical protein
VNKLLTAACCALLLPILAVAQTPPAEPRDDLEPGVNTSAPASAPEPAPADLPRSAPGDAPAPTTSRPTTPTPQASSAAAANKPAASPASGRGNAKDRLELDSTQITGNRELPKVLYIVPWRGAELGDLVGRPVNSLLDEVLEPVDRDVFRRQNRYYEALQPNEAAPASKPEK